MSCSDTFWEKELTDDDVPKAVLKDLWIKSVSLDG